jgi:hypothetical protein
MFIYYIIYYLFIVYVGSPKGASTAARRPCDPFEPCMRSHAVPAVAQLD